MRCDEMATRLPGLVDGDGPLDLEAERHAATCLRCQADLARYRRLRRNLLALADVRVPVTAELLESTFAHLDEGAERRGSRSRYLAYAGAIGGAAVAATATAAVIVVRSRRGLKLAG